MSVKVTIPHVGESIQEAVLVEWFKQDGATVTRDEALCAIETDKVTLEVAAEVDGVLKIQVQAGATVAVDTVLATIEPSDRKEDAEPSEGQEIPTEETPAPAPDREAETATAKQESKSADFQDRPSPAPPKPSAAPVAAPAEPLISPAVRRLLAEKQLDPGLMQGTGPGGRLTKGDVLLYLEQTTATEPGDAVTSPAEQPADQPADQPVDQPAEVRKPLSPLRKRIAARLVEAKQQTAMVTTFNDIDMERVMAERAQFKDLFQEKHHVSLGFMSYFVKACVTALQEIPELNASMEGEDIVYHNAQHIGVAIGSGRGLVVPVIRHAERLGFAEIEHAILSFVEKIKTNRLELADLEGGTFTISNGGVYGSLLSTPLLNLPQSGILGMHRIEQRPVVKDNQVVIRPMMYVALTYDHRLVDGREGVTFLGRVKELVENPERLLLEV